MAAPSGRLRRTLSPLRQGDPAGLRLQRTNRRGGVHARRAAIDGGGRSLRSASSFLPALSVPSSLEACSRRTSTRRARSPQHRPDTQRHQRNHVTTAIRSRERSRQQSFRRPSPCLPHRPSHRPQVVPVPPPRRPLRRTVILPVAAQMASWSIDKRPAAGWRRTSRLRTQPTDPSPPRARNAAVTTRSTASLALRASSSVPDELATRRFTPGGTGNPAATLSGCVSRRAHTRCCRVPRSTERAADRHVTLRQPASTFVDPCRSGGRTDSGPTVCGHVGLPALVKAAATPSAPTDG